MKRLEARRAIVDAANAGRTDSDRYRMRHLQWAVFVVRQKQLVDVDVLTAAGFRGAR